MASERIKKVGKTIKKKCLKNKNRKGLFKTKRIKIKIINTKYGRKQKKKFKLFINGFEIKKHENE